MVQPIHDNLQGYLPTAAAMLQISLSNFLPSSSPNAPMLIASELDHPTSNTASFTSPTTGLHTTVPNANPLGSTLFILYIILALYFTYRVLLTIEARFDAHWSQLSPHRKRTVSVFFSLALVSFASLSWHMLAFLISHYQQTQWRHHQAGLLGDVVKRERKDPLLAILGRVWHWTTHSALFTDFARSLSCGGEGSSGFWWAKQDLLGTLSSYVFVNVARRGSAHDATAGVGRRGDMKVTIWPFIALAQILPISFSLNLFYVYLLLSEPRPAASSADNGQKRTLETEVSLFASLASIGASVLLHAVYTQTLDAFPAVSDDTTLISLVMATRILLLLAAFAPITLSATPGLYEYSKPLMALGSLAAVAVSLLNSGYWTMEHNHAVETLRYDFVIWAVSVNVWYWMSEDPIVSKLEIKEGKGKE